MMSFAARRKHTSTQFNFQPFTDPTLGILSSSNLHLHNSRTVSSDRKSFGRYSSLLRSAFWSEFATIQCRHTQSSCLVYHKIISALHSLTMLCILPSDATTGNRITCRPLACSWLGLLHWCYLWGHRRGIRALQVSKQIFLPPCQPPYTQHQPPPLQTSEESKAEDGIDECQGGVLDCRRRRSQWWGYSALERKIHPDYPVCMLVSVWITLIRTCLARSGALENRNQGKHSLPQLYRSLSLTRPSSQIDFLAKTKPKRPTTTRYPAYEQSSPSRQIRRESWENTS